MSWNAFMRWLGVEAVTTSATERVVAALAGGMAIWVLAWISLSWLPANASASLVASMGASAVILFVTPHSPLAQPWPMIAGHLVAAFAGVLCAKYVQDDAVSCACAVGLTIALMHLLRCLHPPGGGTALAVILGSDQVHEIGFQFLVTPVAMNAVVLVLLAVVINLVFPWRRYPTALFARRAVHSEVAPTHDEILAALRKMDAFVDIAEEELIQLIELLSKKKR